MAQTAAQKKVSGSGDIRLIAFITEPGPITYSESAPPSTSEFSRRRRTGRSLPDGGMSSIASRCRIRPATTPFAAGMAGNPCPCGNAWASPPGKSPTCTKAAWTRARKWCSQTPAEALTSLSQRPRNVTAAPPDRPVTRQRYDSPPEGPGCEARRGRGVPGDPRFSAATGHQPEISRDACGHAVDPAQARRKSEDRENIVTLDAWALRIDAAFR